MKEIIIQICEILVAAIILFGLVYIALYLVGDDGGYVFGEMKSFIEGIFSDVKTNVDWIAPKE